MNLDFFHRRTQPLKIRPHEKSGFDTSELRLRIVVVVFTLLFICVLTRLAYWQLSASDHLKVVAANQYQRKITYEGERGYIYTADGFLVVGNQPTVNLFGQPHLLNTSPTAVTQLLVPYLAPYVADEWQNASQSGTLAEKLDRLKSELTTKLSRTDTKWTSLFHNLKPNDAAAIKNLTIRGLAFENEFIRRYPEASMASQVLGFVGQNEKGEATGYFGLEGALNNELRSQVEQRTIEADALGGRLDGSEDASPPHGRDIVVTLRRDVQHLAETSLKAGIEKYGAVAGEVIIMEPKTGKILAMASYPTYDQSNYQAFDAHLYRNPSISSFYEPGSTFKILTVAAGIDSGVITQNTQCPRCSSARTIADYTLKTWNDQYNPNITMTDALAKSDNTAMIYIVEELGSERFQSYLKKFGIGSNTHVELQEDSSAEFPEKWGPVELATRSFGQGISTTSLQLLKAVNAIANHGKIMRPLIVAKVINPTTKEIIEVKPVEEVQVVSPKTAEVVTEMMVNSAVHGEAQWTASRTHIVAGKTGTAQVASDGRYDPTKTIASFVGFVPAHNPQFSMIVKLTAPTTSPWAAETAAPLWYQIAKKMYLLLNIPPDLKSEAESLPPSSTTTPVTLD